MNVYFVSGLAADSRVFTKIILPEGYKPVFLEWIQPRENETLEEYACRLAASIDTSRPFALIGLSMGGMIATEIAKRYHPATTILISSIPRSAELPFYFKVAGNLRLHKLVPVKLVKSAAKWKRLIAGESSEDKALLQAIIRDSDDQFIHWAMNAILQWKGEGLTTPYTHIHGTKDEILPIRFTTPSHIIKNGGHLMIMNRAVEINAILQQVLKAA